MIRRGYRVPVLLAWGVLALLLSTGDVSGNERQDRVRRSSALLREALRTFNVGEYDSTRVFLQAVRDEDPRNPDAFYQLGRLYLAQADTTGAIAILGDGAVQAPLSSRIKLLLARLRISRAEYDQAGSLLNQILAFKPREGEALYLRGMVGLAIGDSLQAISDWQHALERSVQEPGRR